MRNLRVFSSTALGLAMSMKALLCGRNLTKVPFGSVALSTLTRSPCSTPKFCIIQCGMSTLPSLAMNSSTPQCNLRPFAWLVISKSMGYAISSCDSCRNADGGSMIFPVENVFVCLSRAWQEQKGECAGRTADRLTSCLQRFGVGLVSRGNWHCMVPLRKVLLSEPSATQTRTNELREMGRNETQHSMQASGTPATHAVRMRCAALVVAGLRALTGGLARTTCLWVCTPSTAASRQFSSTQSLARALIDEHRTHTRVVHCDCASA